MILDLHTRHIDKKECVIVPHLKKYDTVRKMPYHHWYWLPNGICFINMWMLFMRWNYTEKNRLIYSSAVQLHHQSQVDGNQVNMVPGIKKIIHSYTTSAWMPFLLMIFFLLIASILVVYGGLYVKSPLNHSTNLFIKLYACSLLGQLYVSFCNFFGEGTKTGTIQLLLFIVSLLISFLIFFFLLIPFWKDFFGI